MINYYCTHYHYLPNNTKCYLHYKEGLDILTKMKSVANENEVNFPVMHLLHKARCKLMKIRNKNTIEEAIAIIVLIATKMKLL